MNTNEKSSDKVIEYVETRILAGKLTAGDRLPAERELAQTLNVSRTAAGLGEPVTAMGFTGGFNGQYLESLLARQYIRCAFTRVAGETRSCINCWDLSDNRSTEYLEPGEPVTGDDLRRFEDDFVRELPGADAVTISGSMPAGVPDDFYCRLIRRCRRSCNYVSDVTFRSFRKNDNGFLRSNGVMSDVNDCLNDDRRCDRRFCRRLFP